MNKVKAARSCILNRITLKGILTLITMSVLNISCGEVEKIGDLRTPGTNDNVPTPEKVQTIDASTFKPEEVFTESNYTEGQMWTKIEEQRRENCDPNPPTTHPQFVAGVVQTTSFSRTFRGDHYEFSFLAQTTEVNPNTGKFVQSISPLKVLAKDYIGAYFNQQKDFEDGTLSYLFESNTGFGNMDLDFYEILQKQLNPKLSNRLKNSFKLILKSSNKDPRLCQFAPLSEELIKVAIGKSIQGSVQVPAYLEVMRREGTLNCGGNKTYMVEIEDQEIRSLKVISPDGISYCKGGVISQVRSIYELTQKPDKRILVLVDRKDTKEGTLIP